MAVKVQLDDRDTVRLPKSEWNKVQRLRSQMLDDLVAAADEVGAALDGDVAKVVKRIKASNYNRDVIERETRKLMDRHYGRLGEVLGTQVANAASLADRYNEIVQAYARQRIRRHAPKTLSDAAIDTLLRRGRPLAKSALATEVLLSQPASTPLKFVGDRVLATHVEPWKQVRVLSPKLHGRAVKASREITTQVVAASREAKNLTRASTDLIREVRKAGKGELGGKARVSKLVEQVEKAGQNLNRRGGEEALAEWRKARAKLRKYIRRLDEGGRIRSSLVELLQRTSADSAKGIDRAITQHAAFTQKYQAERILKTETMANFKGRQVLQDQRHDWIVGYIWRMNRGARRGFVRRRTGKSGRIVGAKKYRRGGRRRRCVCEELDGKRLSKDAVAGRDARLMAHPHCMCWLEPVMDKRRLDAPLSEAELEGLD
jgi:hypothetical protein